MRKTWDYIDHVRLDKVDGVKGVIVTTMRLGKIKRYYRVSAASLRRWIITLDRLDVDANIGINNDRLQLTFYTRGATAIQDKKYTE